MEITIRITDDEMVQCRKAYELFKADADVTWTLERYLKVTYSVGGYDRVIRDIEVYSD